jgi:hypothetical protein
MQFCLQHVFLNAISADFCSATEGNAKKRGYLLAIVSGFNLFIGASIDGIPCDRLRAPYDALSAFFLLLSHRIPIRCARSPLRVLNAEPKEKKALGSNLRPIQFCIWWEQLGLHPMHCGTPSTRSAFRAAICHRRSWEANDLAVVNGAAANEPWKGYARPGCTSPRGTTIMHSSVCIVHSHSLDFIHQFKGNPSPLLNPDSLAWRGERTDSWQGHHW